MGIEEIQAERVRLCEEGKHVLVEGEEYDLETLTVKKVRYCEYCDFMMQVDEKAV